MYQSVSSINLLFVAKRKEINPMEGKSTRRLTPLTE